MIYKLDFNYSMTGIWELFKIKLKAIQKFESLLKITNIFF